MLTPQQLATIRAALLYWQEEMCPHAEETMQSYLGTKDSQPLTAQEIAELRTCFLPPNVRYAHYHRQLRRLGSTQLFLTGDLAMHEAKRKIAVATVLLPFSQR